MISIPLVTNNIMLLLMHVIIIPFIILHWILNNNECSLTTIEKLIKQKYYNDNNYVCFTCKLIEPVYDFKNNYYNFYALIYGITIILWLICIYKIYKQLKNIDNNIMLSFEKIKNDDILFRKLFYKI